MKNGHSKRVMAVAYHEAGHAVAAWRQFLNFKHVTIKPDMDAGSLGHLLPRFPKWFRPDADSSDRQRLCGERHIVMCFAGQIAQSKFLGRKPRYGMHGDNQHAVDMALYFCGSGETASAYLRYCFLVSQDLVSTNWQEVEKVASALVERQTLTHTEVIEIICPGSTALRASLEAKKVARPL